jgi:hypothetical protein
LKIVEDQTLRMENVLSYRRELTPSDFKMAVKEINTLITELNATKTGHTVTVNHVVFVDNAPKSEFEILVPLDRKVEFVRNFFSFKPVFYLEHAVKLSYSGKYSELNTAAVAAQKYISDHNLVPVTPAYCVNIQEYEPEYSDRDIVEDIYIGISRNVL